MIRTVVIKHNICTVLLVSILYLDLCFLLLLLFFFLLHCELLYAYEKKVHSIHLKKKTRTIYCKCA